MKYIRTKDRIFSEQQIRNTNHNEDGTELTWQDIERIVKWFAIDGKIERIADTIEELCDEFVDIDNHDYYKIAHEHGVTFALSKTRRFIGHYDIRLKEIGQIMGAIWTDKGLIYVAKMNEKGELELL